MIKLFRFLKIYRITIAFVFVLVFLQSLANLYLPTLMADIVDKGIVKNDTAYILRVGGVMLLVTVGGTICSVIASFYSARIATGFGRLIRRKIFSHEEKRFDEANLDLANIAIKVNRIVAVLWPIMMLVLNLTSIAILWFGAIRIDHGDMQVGALLAFLQYAMQILFAFLMVSMMFIMLPRASASADRINQVLAMEPEIRDAATVKRADTQRGYVEFQNVTFSYPGAEEPALCDISFQARPGEVTAIIGGTGSGKSTLISLIH